MSYSSDDSSNAFGTIRVAYGFGVLETLGQLLVLHDSTGARISCQVIGDNCKKLIFYIFLWKLGIFIASCSQTSFHLFVIFKSEMFVFLFFLVINVNSHGVYPEYAGDLTISGSVSLNLLNDGVVLTYDLMGVDSDCTAPTDSKPKYFLFFFISNKTTILERCFAT